jgi:hypothetical protein
VTVETVVEVDGANSSPVPARGAQRGEGNVYLESLGFANGACSYTCFHLMVWRRHLRDICPCIVRDD